MKSHTALLKPGVSDALICLMDLPASLGALAGGKIPPGDAPDSANVLPALLGESKVNIATFHLGRTAPGGEAIALVEVDQGLTPAILDTVRGLPNVIQVKALRF